MLVPPDKPAPDDGNNESSDALRPKPSKMTTATPQIILADFSSPETTYLLPSGHTSCSYTALLSHAHSIFNHPSSLWKAHIHLDSPPTCGARAFARGWDEGWYFRHEHLDDKGRLTAWVHFERWGLEERIAVARRELGIEEEEDEGKKERERREVLEKGDECAERGEWWDAVGWWKMAGRMEGGMKREKEDAEDLKDEEKPLGRCEKCGQSPIDGKDSTRHPPLDLLQTQLTDTIHVSLSNTLKSTITSTIDSTITSTIDSSIRRALEAHTFPGPPLKRKRTSSTSTSSTFHPPIPWPLFPPTTLPPPPTSPPLTIDPYSTHPLYSTALIVGRALPSFCRSPLLLPLVRATLVAQGGVQARTRVYTWVPAAYAAAAARQPRGERTGEMQIPHGEVEWLEEFACGDRRERAERVKAWFRDWGVGAGGEVEEGEEGEEGEFERIDTYTGTGFLQDSVVVGTARVGVCADARRRPLVRATLTNDGRVVAYMPARWSNHGSRARGEVLVAWGNVEFCEEFDAPGLERVRQNVRDVLVEKRKALLNGESGTVSQKSEEMEDEGHEQGCREQSEVLVDASD